VGGDGGAAAADAGFIRASRKPTFDFSAIISSEGQQVSQWAVMVVVVVVVVAGPELLVVVVVVMVVVLLLVLVSSGPLENPPSSSVL
jgi:hypothetical protein